MVFFIVEFALQSAGGKATMGNGAFHNFRIA